jgi:hypothetical protein
MSTVDDGKKSAYPRKSIIQMMQDQEGRNYSHTLAKNVKVTCDGTACEPDQIKVGSTIRVTTKQHDDDEALVTSVESLDEERDFATRS